MKTTPSPLAWKRQVCKTRVKKFLKQLTGCHIQHDGWPCGSCFFAAQPDNFNASDWGEMWHAVLALRGDYDDNFRLINGKPSYEMVSGHEMNADGTFKCHIKEIDMVSTYVQLLTRMNEENIQ